MFRVQQDTLFVSQSLAADFTSNTYDVSGCYTSAFELSWAGVLTADSTIKVQGSISGVNWCDILNSSITLSAGSGCKFYEWPAPLGLTKLRIVYTANTNTAGSMSAITLSKFDRSGDNPGRAT